VIVGDDGVMVIDIKATPPMACEVFRRIGGAAARRDVDMWKVDRLRRREDFAAWLGAAPPRRRREEEAAAGPA